MDAFVGVTFGEPLQLENHSVIDAISLTSGQSIMFPLHLSEPAFNAHFELFGDNNGDADLYVRPAVSAGEVEGSTQVAVKVMNFAHSSSYLRVITGWKSLLSSRLIMSLLPLIGRLKR